MDHSSSEHRPLKRLGQNFLVDNQIANEIVSSSKLTRTDTVLEPGPGKGALTRRLVKLAGKVIAVEKDPFLARQLQGSLSDFGNLEVIQGDFLKTSLPEFNKVVTTPPYYLSSKLILFLTKTPFESASIVLQREFGERLAARAGTREYGRLSVLSNRNFHVDILRNIPRSAFQPQPKVESLLVTLTRKKSQTKLNEEFFQELVRGMFTQRRRLVRSALAHFLTLRLGKGEARRVMEQMQVPDRRVYELSVDELEKLSILLSDIVSEDQMS